MTRAPLSPDMIAGLHYFAGEPVTLPARSYGRTRDALARRGLIVESGDLGPYVLTDAGRERHLDVCPAAAGQRERYRAKLVSALLES